MHKKIKLTESDQKIMDYIQEFTQQYGYAPTVREIGEGVSLRSPQTVHYHLKRLEQSGYLQWKKKKVRTLDVKQDTSKKHLACAWIPVLNNSAFHPDTEHARIQSFFPILQKNLPDGQFFMMEYQNSSTQIPGILEKDLLIVRRYEQSEEYEGNYQAILVWDPERKKQNYMLRIQTFQAKQK